MMAILKLPEGRNWISGGERREISKPKGEWTGAATPTFQNISKLRRQKYSIHLTNIRVNELKFIDQSND